ncbi:MAG TPA: lysine--tRNA ligase [Patescibacteria group bacterium]|nr:lysine--tRNA ligase [Patescibacteria group bacterium]
MFWADRVAKEIIDSGKHEPYWVDDMFTPSGFAHVGSLRGPLVHDMVYRGLVKAGQKSKWTYIMNDFDVIDGLPQELEKDFSQYMGVVLRLVPSPEKGFDNFADYFAKDFQKVLRELGVEAEFLSSFDMYKAGKFNDVIRLALDNSEKILDIYQRVSGSKKREAGWLPLQVICENCGKLGTTRVHDWDGETVAYTCEKAMVKWAEGCGHTGRISPFDGNGKLPWKVDWPAHWKVLGITIEGAGKDHSSAGGSRDIARELCKEVFDYPDPFNIPYEFFLIGGKKMSSSKGLGLKGRDLTKLLPPEVGRFLFTRTDYKKAIEFDPMGTMAIPMLFDEYQKAAESYFSKTGDDLARAFEYSHIGEIMKPPSVRFSVLAQWIQMPNMENEIKKAGAESWADYARIWIEQFAPESEKFLVQDNLPDSARSLSDKQKEYLQKIVDLLPVNDVEEFQTRIYEIARDLDITPKESFGAIYSVLIGKDHGPKAAWFISSLDPEFIKKRFKEAYEAEYDNKVQDANLTRFDNSNIFSIDKELGQKYPSISVGIAVIKGVNIKKTDERLEKEKEELLKTLQSLTTEQLGEYEEVKDYRKLYKEMGVDWHSRRPSPEALLRRIATKKGLYTVNTCVDAYNLVVMKNRISVGAFDYDSIAFPTVIRFAKEGEKILLLGDQEATPYTEKEIAYFDEKGGYNMDFNYRDSQRTAVQLDTKNILLNVDGIFGISPEKVEEVLRQACDKIIEYCGGELSEFGVVTAS